MKITLITCSKQSSKEISTLCNQYLTRIARFAKIDHINIKPSSHRDLAKRRIEDTTKMYAKVSKQGFVICCDEKGKRYSSKAFANHINQAFHHASHIFFIFHMETFSYGALYMVARPSNVMLDCK